MKTVKGEIKGIEIEVEYQPDSYILEVVGKYLMDILEGMCYSSCIHSGKLRVTYRASAKDYLKSKQIIDNTVNQIMAKLLDLNETVKFIANNEERRHLTGKAEI